MIALFLTTESFLRGLYSFIQAPMMSISGVPIPHPANYSLHPALPSPPLSTQSSLLSTEDALRYALCSMRASLLSVGTGKIKSNLKTKEPKADLTVCRGSGATDRLKSGPGSYRYTPVAKIRFVGRPSGLSGSRKLRKGESQTHRLYH